MDSMSLGFVKLDSVSLGFVSLDYVSLGVVTGFGSRDSMPLIHYTIYIMHYTLYITPDDST